MKEKTLDEKLEDLLDQLEEKRLILHWLINGYGRIGLPIGAVSVLTKEWIVQRYHVEMTYFKKDKK